MKPLKPVMAALLAAVSTAFALPGTSFATAPEAAGASAAKARACPPAATADTLNILSCLIAQDKGVQADIGERLARFVQTKDAKGDFLYILIRDAGDAKFLPNVVETAKKWPATVAAKGDPDDVAVLYFVLGPDDGQPAWAKNTSLAGVLKPDMKWNGRLQIRLKDAHLTDSLRFVPNAVDKGGVADFLNIASTEAWSVFNDPRTQQEAQESVEAHNTTGATSPVLEGNSRRLDANGSGFGFDDLYRTGARTGMIYGPKDDGYRELSMKVYTTKDEKGNLINQIGIVDITANDISSPSVPRFIDVSKAGESEIVLREGGRHYKVTVGADGTVTLSRPGGKAEDDEGGIRTSIGELTAARDAQIMGRGKVMIEGQPYYVLGQGGAKGSYLFFSQAEMDAAPTGNAHPALMGEVTQVIGDGSTSPIKGHPDLGKLPNGSAWHLEFDPATRLWKVTKGEGDKPGKGGDTPPSTSTTTAKVARSGSSAPAGKSDTTDTPLLSALLDLPKYKGWSEGEGNDTISDDMKDQFKIMKDKDGVDHVISPAVVDANGNYEWTLESKPEMRAFKRYVVVALDGGNVNYYDLPALQAVLDKETPSLPGFYNHDANSFEAKDIDVAADIIEESMKKDDVDLKPGVDKYGAGGSYRITGTVKAGKFGVRLVNSKTKKNCEIWPDQGKCVDAKGTADPTADKAPAKTPDQGADVDGAPKAYAGCRDTLTEPDGKTTVSVFNVNGAKTSGGILTDDVCMYEHANGKKPSTYSLTVLYETEDGAAHSPEAVIFGEVIKKPDVFHYKSIGGKKAQANPQAQVKRVDGSDDAHGVYGLFQSGDSNPDAVLKDKAADCLGVVVSWNMSDADALKACQERIIQTPKTWKNAWHIFG